MWLLDKLLRRLIRVGQLTIIDARGRTYRYGHAGPNARRVTIRFTEPRTPLRIARNPRLATGEAFMDGQIVVEDGAEILDLLDLVLSNAPWERGGPARRAVERGGNEIAARLDRFNWKRRSRRNVAHHYDLSDRFNRLFLDPDLQYSCAYFREADMSLEAAQEQKRAHIAAKLAPRPGQQVLDIGCGWGGLALYLNRVADVDVLGITISQEQLGVARARAMEAGVSDRVRFELLDYREVAGLFDRIVSVGMFEHVGPPQYPTFFAKCRELLADDGVMLLHTIGRLGKPGVTDPWTAKYIFPGGYCPALSEIAAASEKVKLIASDVETLRLHYALTLEQGYVRTVAARQQICAQYDERFFRMWQFYLAGATCAFRYSGLGNYQIQYVKRRQALPIARDCTTAEQLLLADGRLR